MKFSTSLIFVLFLGFSNIAFCQDTKPNVQKASFQPACDESKFIFLNYHIKKTASNPDGELVLTSVKIISGKTKPFVAPSQTTGHVGQLAVLLKNTSGEVVSQTIIENPLQQVVEYPNENGVIGQATITKTEADFSVRLPYSADCSLNEIHLFKEDGSQKTISSLTITTNNDVK